MSVQVERATLPCTVCGALVSEVRRGRCWGCYKQWAEMRPVGRGATCTVCSERRRDHLRLVEVHARTLPLCHICAARVIRLPDVPPTVEGIRDKLRRNRRALDRRDEALDHRIFPRERRVGDRRADARPDSNPAVDLTVPDLDDLIIEIDESDIEEIEQTLVRAAPTRRP
jgi:hypothetical protein